MRLLLDTHGLLWALLAALAMADVLVRASTDPAIAQLEGMVTLR